MITCQNKLVEIGLTLFYSGFKLIYPFLGTADMIVKFVGVSMPPGKSLKVLEFFSQISRPSKILEYDSWSLQFLEITSGAPH